MKKLKIDYKHIVSIGIVLGCVVCTFLLFPHSIGRIIESIRDLFLSFVYYIGSLIGVDFGLPVTVNDLPKYPFFDFIEKSSPSSMLPEAYSEFRTNWVRYWELWLSLDNLVSYLNFIAGKLYGISYVVVLILPLIIGLRLMLKRLVSRPNNNYNLDTIPLRVYKWVVKNVCVPIYDWVLDFLDFLACYEIYKKLIIIVWLINFNIITIIVEAVAYYLYFLVEFSFAKIYIQFYKLFLDLSVPLRFIPMVVWLVIGLYLFHRFRTKIAILDLIHRDNRNKGFVNERGLLVFCCGRMRTGKTAAISDMSLTQETMFRDFLYDHIVKTDLKFPHFPWINLENEIKKAIESREINTLATCKRFIYKRQQSWERQKTIENMFGYNYEQYGMIYDDGIKLTNIWEILEIYTKLYFVYIIKSSLLVSNYSIRSDNVLMDEGNFPLWNTSLLHRNSSQACKGNYAHILDFDMLRLGRKIITDNPNRYAFEFGILCATEFGKDRLNNLELQGIKKDSKDVNQKNDLLVYMLKMLGHVSTIDNFTYFRGFFDEQRPTSLGADVRCVTEMVHIRSSSESKLALPFFSLEELLYSFIFNRFEGSYREYRYNRGDNTLIMYLFKNLAGRFHRYYTRIYNKFSYKRLEVDVEDGDKEGEFKQSVYYLIPRKIYAYRYATDCYNGFFNERALRSEIGLNDLPSYKGLRATLEEMKKQNSFFERDMSEWD